MGNSKIAHTAEKRILIPEEYEHMEYLREIVASYKGHRSELISVLQEAQEKLGYLSKETMTAIAEFLHMSPSAVYSVATFYNQFRFVPPGRHPIKVCLGTACHMASGPLVLEAAERELDIKVGDVTEDLEFSVDRVACVGCCSLAPVVVIGDTFYSRMSALKMEEILVSIKQESMGRDSE